MIRPARVEPRPAAIRRSISARRWAALCDAERSHLSAWARFKPEAARRHARAFAAPSRLALRRRLARPHGAAQARPVARTARRTARSPRRHRAARGASAARSDDGPGPEPPPQTDALTAPAAVRAA